LGYDQQIARAVSLTRKIHSKADLAVFNLLDQPIWVWDLANNVAWWANNAARRFCQLSESDALEDFTFAADNQDISRLQDYVARLEDGESATYDPWILNVGDKQCAVDCKISPIELKSGEALLLFESQEISDKNNREQYQRLTTALTEQKENESRLYDFARSTSEWLWEADVNLRISSFHHRFEEFIGDLSDERHPHITREFLAEVASQNEDMASSKWQSFFATIDARKPFRDFVYERKRHEKTGIILKISGVPYSDDRGEFAGYRGSTQDVTAVVNAEKELKKQSRMFQEALAVVGEGVVVFDKNDVVVACSDDYLKMIGNIFSRDELGEITFEDMIRRSVDAGNLGQTASTKKAIIKKRLEQHANPPFVMELYTATNRWVRILERATADGGTVLSVADVTDLKDREEQLELNEKRFREFAESGADWFWEMDSDLKFTYITGFSQEIMGSPNDDAIGKTRAEVLLHRLTDMDEKKWAVWHDVEEKMLRQESYRDLVYSVVNEDGEVIHIRNSGVPTFDNDGIFLGYRGAAANITAEVKAELANQRSRQQFIDAIDGIDAAISVYDKDNNFVVGNRRFRDKVNSASPGLATPGVSLEAILRKSIATGLFGDVDGDPEGFLARNLEGHKNAKLHEEYQSDTGDWFVTSVKRTSEGGTLRVQTLVTDIKERELAVKASEVRYRDLFEESIEGILVSGDTRLKIANQAAAEIFGYDSVADILSINSTGDLMSDFMKKEMTDRRKRRLAGEPDLLSAYEFKGIKKNGDEIWLDSRHSLVQWDGEPAAMATFVDVSERKAAEEKLRMAIDDAQNANRAKSEFLANMSHELRTPLNAIIGFSDMLSAEYAGPVNARQKSYLKDVESSGTHLLGLINDILDLSKIEAGKVILQETVVEINTVVEECVRLLMDRAVQVELTMIYDKPRDACLYRADERLIRQIMLNLLSNSIKFTPAGGKVEVTVTALENDMLTITVRDTGIGIAKDDISKVLAPFGQVEGGLDRRFEGTGLGLPLVASLAELHGGKFDLKSDSGKGTMAIVTLPANRKVI
jgi:PAS domain S-box-containing protein